jgi:hypothetical protein
MPNLKKSRYQPSITMFRQRYLYAFGGQNFSSSKAIDKPTKFVGEIERLDVREGSSWEIVKLNSSINKLKGHSLGTLQISSTEILIFGTYLKETQPCFD